MLRRFALSFLLMLSPTAALAEPVPQTPFEALSTDARSYAAAHGVTEEEALRRLRLQIASIAVSERLRTEYRTRLAGLSVEHSPEWRLVLLLTGEGPERELRLTAGEYEVPVLIRGGAQASREQVLAAIDGRREAIRRVVPGIRGVGHDPRDGSLLVLQRASSGRGPLAELEAELAEIAGVPVRVRRIRAELENAAAGGSRVVGAHDGRNWVCTTGFMVRAGNNRALTTAAHCPDDLSYRGPNGEERLLKLVGSWGAASRDVQVHAGVGAGEPLFYADTQRTVTRPVTGWWTRPMTRAGDWVCMRGESSGASCAEVDLTDFAPPGELCGGLCSASWVTVKGPVCRHGDSGAPVFLGTTALGLLKGGSFVEGGGCAFYFYMSVDYLPEEWRLVTAN